MLGEIVAILGPLLGFALLAFFLVRYALRANARAEQAWTEAATQLGAEKSESREGLERIVRIARGSCAYEVQILLQGSEGGTHRQGSAEHTRLRYAVRPPLPGMLLAGPMIDGAGPEQAGRVLDMMLPDLLGRPPATPSTGVDRCTLAEGLVAFAHAPAAARFGPEAVAALRALRTLGSCGLVADPAGLVVVLQGTPRGPEAIVRWFEAVERLGRALDGSTQR